MEYTYQGKGRGRFHVNWQNWIRIEREYADDIAGDLWSHHRVGLYLIFEDLNVKIELPLFYV